MRIDFYIARRLRVSDTGGNRVKTSVRISTVGVVLSVVIMMITIAVTSGFKDEIVNKLTGFNSQLTVEPVSTNPLEQQQCIENGAAVMAIVQETLPDAEVTESVKMPGMLKTADNFAAVMFCGYGGAGHGSFIADNIVEGESPSSIARGLNEGEDSENYANVGGKKDANVGEGSDANAIVISSTVAGQLGLDVGDKINTCFFTEGKMRLRNFTVAAIYNSGFIEYDKSVVYAPLPTLRRIAGLGDGQVASIEISGLNIDELPQAQMTLQRAFSNAYYDRDLAQYMQVGSIMQSGAMYFNWLSLLDTNVVVILILMTAISAFTLIASLIILILERVNMIGTLKMLGATNGMIQRIFILLDLKVLVKGLIVGNVVGLALILFQQFTHLLPLDPESYYISFVPVKITVLQVVVLNAAAIFVATLIMILPSMMISRLKPATILRYE